MKILLKIKWATFRLIFAFFAIIAILSWGLTGYLLGPLYSWYFFNDFNFPKYYKYLHPIIYAYLRFVSRCIHNSEYRKMFSVSFFAPPRMSPVMDNLRIHKTWTGPIENCDGCINCCIKIKCPLLDTKNRNCLSYGSFYWRHFNCGRYPVNKCQIEYYECPKWEFIEK